MDENNKTGDQEEKDFVSSAKFQKTVRRSRLKQFSLYIVVSIVSITLLIVLLSIGGQYLMDKKIEKAERKAIENHPIVSEEPVKGAGIVSIDTAYTTPNLFYVDSKSTYYKKVGDKKVVWDIVRKRYPAIGKVKTLGSKFVRTEEYLVNPRKERAIKYNHLNNERRIDFYYPELDYSFLSQELDNAVGLDENTLIEVALSFKEPLHIDELGDTLGYQNVDWLWADQTSEERITELKTSNYDNRILSGEQAYGFLVSERSPYTNSRAKDYLISGAVVSGKPSELKRFQDLDIIRASVIGVTVDEY
ncbi:Sigma factor regulator C-terminal [Oceanobacillus limi]|uniref:Sigma factor regulator C-terminal n=1 Tax=Oceanobacillus limi TaxID=930131 RepID=A0A1H9Y3U2_9BACI|nr:anti sigma factor C-terminal domain-containing protein [Oceanobacillus limi]SES63415.1 Sigma factor regulator C-terminal [Oceanobacillus limi]